MAAVVRTPMGYRTSTTPGTGRPVGRAGPDWAWDNGAFVRNDYGGAGGYWLNCAGKRRKWKSNYDSLRNERNPYGTVLVKSYSPEWG